MSNFTRLVFVSLIITSTASAQAGFQSWYFSNTSGGNGFGSLIANTPQNDGVWTTQFSWPASTGYRAMKWGLTSSTSPTCAGVTSTCAPNADPGNSLVSDPYTGVIPGGNWIISFCLNSISSFSESILLYWGLWKSVNADGSGATQFSAGPTVNLSILPNGQSTCYTKTNAVGATTFTNERLFLVVLVWKQHAGGTIVAMTDNNSTLKAYIQSPLVTTSSNPWFFKQYVLNRRDH